MTSGVSSAWRAYAPAEIVDVRVVRQRPRDDRGAAALGGAHRPREVCAGQDERELVAADAAGELAAARDAAQARADLREHLVAGDVAVRVVQLLEPVEVHDRDGERRALAIRARDLAGQPLLERAAVGEARQRVGRRAPLERRAARRARDGQADAVREAVQDALGVGVQHPGAERGDADRAPRPAREDDRRRGGDEVALVRPQRMPLGELRVARLDARRLARRQHLAGRRAGEVDAAADGQRRAARDGDQTALVLREAPHDAGRVDAQQGVRLARDEVEDDVGRCVGRDRRADARDDRVLGRQGRERACERAGEDAGRDDRAGGEQPHAPVERARLAIAARAAGRAARRPPRRR